MSDPAITYKVRSDATAEGEVNALAAIYKLVLAKKKAAPTSRPDDAKETKNVRAETSIPKTG